MIAMKWATALGAAALAVGVAASARADALLDESVEFSGTIAFLSSGAPAMVMAAVKDGQTAFFGMGEIADDTGIAPTETTLMRIGSVSKVFCGATLGSLVAKGEIKLADRVQDVLGYDVDLPTRDGRQIRVVDLATHASGLPREVPDQQGTPDDPFGGNTRETQIRGLKGYDLLFAPGKGALYSNFGFDLLGATLANVSGITYEALLKERVLSPAGMTDTQFNPPVSERPRMMQGHFFDGTAMPFVPTPVTIECAGGAYTTAADMLKWLEWSLDPAPEQDRMITQAAWLYRGSLDPVSGLDDGGAGMAAMALGWVVTMPEGNRPLILHKSGGLQGMFVYTAIAPAAGIGVFAAINQFSVGGFEGMVHAVNGLISSLAPR